MPNFFKDVPEYNIKLADRRYNLLKKFETYSKRESRRLGERFRVTSAKKRFCKNNGINYSTFNRIVRKYRKGGHEALVPGFGKRLGESRYKDDILPIIHDVMEPGQGYAHLYKKVKKVCAQAGIPMPSPTTVIRLVNASGLRNRVMTVRKSKPIKVVSPKKRNASIRKKANLSLKWTDKHMPEWFQVVDKKNLNIAFYKFGLILPLLDANLDKRTRRKIVRETVQKKHHPYPGVRFGISRTTLYRYISKFKKEGFEGLISPNTFRKVRHHGSQIHARIQIDMSDPLGCLLQVRAIIDKYVTKNINRKKQALEFLDHILGNVGTIKEAKYTPRSLKKKITPEEIAELEKHRNGTFVSERKKATAILMAYDNHSMLEITQAVNRSRGSVLRWFRRFDKEGISSIKVKMNVLKNNPELADRKNRIVSILHRSPHDYGINKTSWTISDISKAYEKDYGKLLSPSTIGRTIKKTDYTWRRAKRVLTNNDPDFREKTKKVLDTLQNLQANEAFFFIDEAGPWRVKKYGGKSLTPKGVTKKYPEFQKSKGRVTFIAALNALTNQVHCAFTETKDTNAVINIIKYLFYRYQGCSKLYLTWDCASWHKSKELNAWLDALDKEKGPQIIVVPLPKKSQYLNVIEAVISGMKRAVVHNSDYGSELEMKMAIYKHFKQRNEYFKVNPKRAGNKIWDKEYYNLDNFESGLFKHV